MSTTPNMILTIDVPLVTPGPDWAADVVANFQLIDLHDHTAGAGVQVPVAGLNINGDLPLNSHNINALRTLRLDNQTSTPSGVGDIRIVYSKNGELAYRDAVGNEVVITNMGSIAGATGTISGLVSPASAVYSSITKSLTVNKDTSKPAKLNISEISIYEFDNAAANPVTLASPASLAAPYTFTLPVGLPSKQAAMLFNTDGSVSDIEASVGVAQYALRVNDAGTGWEAGLIKQGAMAADSVNTSQLVNQSVTAAKIVNATITSTQIAAGGVSFDNRAGRSASVSTSIDGEVLLTNSSGIFNTSSTGAAYTPVTNLSGDVYVANSGSGIKIDVIPDGGGGPSNFSTGTAGCNVGLFRDGSLIQMTSLSPSTTYPCISFVDRAPSTGVHTYSVRMNNTSVSASGVHNMVMLAYEI